MYTVILCVPRAETRLANEARDALTQVLGALPRASLVTWIGESMMHSINVRDATAVLRLGGPCPECDAVVAQAHRACTPVYYILDSIIMFLKAKRGAL